MNKKINWKNVAFLTALFFMMDWIIYFAAKIMEVL